MLIQHLAAESWISTPVELCIDIYPYQSNWRYLQQTKCISVLIHLRQEGNGKKA